MLTMVNESSEMPRKSLNWYGKRRKSRLSIDVSNDTRAERRVMMWSGMFEVGLLVVEVGNGMVDDDGAWVVEVEVDISVGAAVVVATDVMVGAPEVTGFTTVAKVERGTNVVGVLAAGESAKVVLGGAGLVELVDCGGLGVVTGTAVVAVVVVIGADVAVVGIPALVVDEAGIDGCTHGREAERN